MKYIRYNGYKVEDNNCDNCFEVDNKIANTIAILNKKGYYTVSSCAGHTKYDDLEYEITKEEYMTDPSYDVIEKTENGYKVKFEISQANIYIKFLDVSYLKFIPKDRAYKIIDNSVTYPLFLYNEGETEKKSKDVLLEEIKIVNQTLLDWAIDLPDLLEIKKK